MSVVVPVYNGEETISRCLESILGQTRKRIRIVCVNDGSRDDSLDIIREFRKKNWNIKIINQRNKGRAGARNAGLDVVKTKYVMFCDSDDYYDPGMCEKMVNVMEHSDADVAVCGIAVHYDAHGEMKQSDEEYYRIKFEGDKNVDDDVILQTDASVCNKIFKVDLIRKHRLVFPDGLNNEDFYFWNTYVSLCSKVFFIKDKLYNYVRHDGSIMSENFDAKGLSIDHLLVANKIFDFYRKNGFLAKHLDLFWRQWIASFWFSYEHSAGKYRSRIKREADGFLKKNYENYLPSSDEIMKMKKDIDNILKDVKGG